MEAEGRSIQKLQGCCQRLLNNATKDKGKYQSILGGREELFFSAAL